MIDRLIKLSVLQAEKVDLREKIHNRYRLGCVIFRKHRLGCVIFRKHRVLNVGRNQYKTHPKSNALAKGNDGRKKTFAIHAEMDAIIGCSRLDLTGASILIVRIGNTKNLLLSRPCNACMELIRAAKIKNMYYSDNEGNIIKERV